MVKFAPASDQELAEENHLPFNCSRNPLVSMITVAIEKVIRQLTKIAPSNKGIAQLAQHAFLRRVSALLYLSTLAASLLLSRCASA